MSAGVEGVGVVSMFMPFHALVEGVERGVGLIMVVLLLLLPLLLLL